MSSPTMKNKLLVVGCGGGLDSKSSGSGSGSSSSSSSSGQQYATNPVRFLARLTAGGKDQQQEHQGPGDGSVVPWTLNTKYYRAELALHVADVEDEQSEGEGAEGEDTCPFAAHKESLQGVILLCKGSVSPGEEYCAGLAKIEPWLRAAGSQEKLELCLVVGILDSGSGVTEPLAREAAVGKNEDEEEEEDSLQGRRALWCLEYGFEYVEVDYARQVRTLREKEGLERVCECIEATPWQHMDLHPSGASHPRRLEKPDEKVSEQQQGTVGSSASNAQDEKVNSGTRVGYGDVKGGSRMKHGEEGEDDVALDELFVKLRAVRESAGQYDDTQRRARAAEMALQLAQTLGIFEDE